MLKGENNNLKNEINILKKELKVIKGENYDLNLEIKNINLNLDSSIINNDIQKKTKIIEWIMEKTNKNIFKFELIFRMSIHGSDSGDFYKYCENKGPTLLLIKTTKNKIFGGFTPLNWKKENIGAN